MTARRSPAAAPPFWREPEFIGRAVHLLKNHATALQAASHLLLQSGPGIDKSARKRWRAALRDSGARLTRLLDQLGQLAQVHEGGPDAFAPVPLAKWLGEQVRDARAAEPNSRVRLTLARSPAGAWRLSAAPVAVALGALLRNALVHATGGTRAKLTVTTRPGGLLFAIRDHGPGVPPAERPVLFTPFFRGKGALDRPGAGLDLALARAAVAQTGGRIAHRPAKPRGARFELFVPASRARNPRVNRLLTAR
ncbi:MAG: HAMP domain-containing histidine kinase [Opitutaceae bacterium]|nr:HAMP domain-containing histidine kinase [Opitutaceae bacterium]